MTVLLPPCRIGPSSIRVLRPRLIFLIIPRKEVTHFSDSSVSIHRLPEWMVILLTMISAMLLHPKHARVGVHVIFQAILNVEDAPVIATCTAAAIEVRGGVSHVGTQPVVPAWAGGWLR